MCFIFSGKVAGAKMPRVDLKVFRNFPLILPSIQLQNEFASKVEAIEEQKKLIESSIADLETLLASRMDYWLTIEKYHTVSDNLQIDYE